MLLSVKHNFTRAKNYVSVTEMLKEEKLSSKEIKEANFINMKELYRNVTHQNTIKGKVAPDILSYSKFQRKFKMRGKETKISLNLPSLQTIKIKIYKDTAVTIQGNSFKPINSIK